MGGKVPKMSFKKNTFESVKIIFFLSTLKPFRSVSIKFTYESDVLLNDKLPESIKHVFSGSLNGNYFLLQIFKIYLEKKEISWYSLIHLYYEEMFTQDALMYLEGGYPDSDFRYTMLESKGTMS